MQENVNLGVFQETKVTGEVLARESSRYWVMTTEVPSPPRMCIAAFYYEAGRFYLEEL